MPISKKLKIKVMRSLKKTYPNYSVARRQHIRNAILYGKEHDRAVNGTRRLSREAQEMGGTYG